ncbi:hypothetical protein [Streptomyces sp. NPDC051546]|uniref:hypothetical protein n=1 Tax=Streptomyces sp. NPDC051546 TaxID=3365655 RepID=UPI003797CE17
MLKPPDRPGLDEGEGGEQQQTAEGERVGADHPGQVGGGDGQVGLDVRERDVHDRRVEDDHELNAFTVTAVPRWGSSLRERKRSLRLKIRAVDV